MVKLFKKKKSDTNNQKVSEEIQQLFDDKKYEQMENKFYSFNKFILPFSFLISFLIILILFFLSPNTKIEKVTIKGNKYLTDNYYLNLYNQTSNSNILFNIPFIQKYFLLKNQWIQDIDIQFDNNKVVIVTISEKKAVGYYYDENLDNPYILFNDGSTIKMESYSTDVIAKIPYINGLDEDQLITLAKGLDEVNEQIITQIAEVDLLQTSYSDSLFLLLLQDGNYFIGSRFSLASLNYYNNVIAKTDTNGLCLYGDDDNQVISASSCPWEQNEIEVFDYFKDCDGNNILDEQGNPIRIEYAKDINGKYIYDLNGNKTITNQIEMPDCTIEVQQESQRDQDNIQQEDEE